MKPAEVTTAATLRVDRPSAADLARARQVLADETASVADLPAPVVETFRSLLEHFARGEDVVLEIEPSYLTVAEAATLMEVDVETVNRLVGSGRLQVEKENAPNRVSLLSVMRWLEGHQILQEMRRFGYETESALD